ncbi:L-threonylcarbamoyladenylate synthase [Aequorivita vladivostokensis]|jgi:L-threonylcarbamoyladenylate synthase|uniref:L-threonylcarbamoyladenylate synthase n=1 Tax=Aequorivita vladivostokensis TaxID=171194 RepID=A0ABR5DFP3_9FLAO|nr:L-threonylcarbamoyladenylate synthase [Aequorivita vladivostokensis]KJJ37600.1 translation factor Sua5 [Aequorivita vladivostokensis]MAB56237.1 threonylcarbamoyl-AMP synthase [Aequorivita sp.]MBF31750.1 threonylcarbamoyl-AMP synthase [Aequorivita sp.]|tara:strand:- start:16310 stop:16870 length:561 start_codon:yes stop_codon:yes gene_type:complete
MKTEIENCIAVLKKGGLILYPTDTVWGIGCDATNPDAVDKVFKLKQRSDEKSLICLVHDFKMLNEYVENVPEVAYDILKYAKKPTTIIYDNPIRVAENIIAADNSLAIRVAKDEFCKKLIQRFRRPLVSTSANISGEKTPQSYAEIDPLILEGVDYVVNLQHEKKSGKPSAIIKLKNDGSVKVIRQ